MTRPPIGSSTSLDPGRLDASKITVPTAMLKSADIIDFPQTKPVPDAPHPASIHAERPSEGGKGGEGGNAAPFAPIALTNRQFLETIFGDAPSGAVPLITSKAGDPSTGAWVAHRADEVERLCTSDRNTYFNCASFNPRADGSFAATLAQAAAYHVLLLDDVGTKVDESLITLTPTWKLQTSPGNFQVGYKLKKPLRDQGQVTRFLDRIAGAGLTDRGAKGMTRWARLPNGINGKAKYLKAGMHFRCKLFHWNADVSYSEDEILEALVPTSTTATVEASNVVPAARPRNFEVEPEGKCETVYVPKPVRNHVVEELTARGLYKRQIVEGKHDITCPWVREHTDALDTGACYFEPSLEYPIGGFKCQHSHGDDYHIAELLDYLELDPQTARNRPLLRSTEGHLHSVVRGAEHVLSQQPNYYQAGGAIVRVSNGADGEPKLEAVSDTSLTLALSELCDWKKFDGRKSSWVTCDPPERAVRLLLQAKPYTHLRPLEGFARQPFYRAGDGSLVFAAGYDIPSKRLAVFDAAKFTMPEPTREAAVEALATLDELLGEFHYAAEVDKAAALSAVLTAIVRPSLETAPAYHVAAPSPGSGKSLLCNVLARLASPSEPLRLPYPKDAQEADKVIFASLLPQPPTIMFDDMTDDWKAHGIINSVLTASSITGRILGVSKTATVSTRILFLGSGNNVGPVRDLSRRVVTINLNARSESPATLKYDRDPMAALEANRERFVVAGLTIIEAFKAAGSPKTDVLPIASYNGDWADHCRHPLIWLGLPDPASVLIEQVKSDPEVLMLGQLFQCWYDRFGDKPTKVREALAVDEFCPLHDALYELPVVANAKVDPARLGWFLKKHKDRPVGDFVLEDAQSSNRKAWRVRRLKNAELSTCLPEATSAVAAVSGSSCADDEGF